MSERKIEIVAGTVTDEPERYYVARRLRVRMTDTTTKGISMWMDAFAHDWTIGHHLDPDDARKLGAMLIAIAAECDKVNAKHVATAEESAACAFRDYNDPSERDPS